MRNAMTAIAIASAICIVLILSGCGQVDRTVTQWTGSAERCYDHVRYVNFTTGTSVKYVVQPDGSVKIATC